MWEADSFVIYSEGWSGYEEARCLEIGLDGAGNYFYRWSGCCVMASPSNYCDEWTLCTEDEALEMMLEWDADLKEFEE